MNKKTALGLCIILLLIFGFFVLPFKLLEDSSIKAEELFNLSLRVREFYKNRPDYWGLDTKVVVQNNLASQLYIDENKITIGQGFEGSPAVPGARSFDVVYHGMSVNDCIDLSSFRWDNEELLGLTEVRIRNPKEEVIFSWGGNNPLPVGKKDAESVCGVNNDVMWSFE